MPKFIIEREIPGAGDLTAEQLQNTSQQSCCVLREAGPHIQWVIRFTVFIFHLINRPFLITLNKWVSRPIRLIR